MLLLCTACSLPACKAQCFTICITWQETPFCSYFPWGIGKHHTFPVIVHCSYWCRVAGVHSWNRWSNLAGWEHAWKSMRPGLQVCSINLTTAWKPRAVQHMPVYHWSEGEVHALPSLIHQKLLIDCCQEIVQNINHKTFIRCICERNRTWRSVIITWKIKFWF